MNIDHLVGRGIGQYQLVELLGVGAMGAVYRAHQSALARDVAIKVLPSAMAAQPDYVARFNREAKIAASLEHPHIVPLHDYGQWDGISYVAMRMLTGGTLAQRLNQRAVDEGRLPALHETGSLLRQLASALDYAHRKGVIHRDIKPNNIMFDDEGVAYIVDFGIARLLNVTTSITGGQTIFGTPHYMPPEQWRDEELGPETDQYALGVVIYSMVTGQPPFDAPTTHQLMYKHFHEAAPPPRARRPSLPPPLEPVLMRALEKSPKDRYPSVSAFSQEFDSATGSVQEASTDFFTFPLAEQPPVIHPPVGVYPAPKDDTATVPLATDRQPLEPVAPAAPEPPKRAVLPPAPPAFPPYQPPPGSAAEVPQPKRRLSPLVVGVGLGLALLSLVVCALLALVSPQLGGDGRATIAVTAPPTEVNQAVTSTVAMLGEATAAVETEEIRPTATPTVTLTDAPTAEPSPTDLPMPGAPTATDLPVSLPATPTMILPSTTTPLNLVPLNPPGTRIAVSNARNVGPVASMPHGTEPVRGAAFSASGELIATGAGDGSIHLWSADGTSLGQLGMGGGVANGVAFSPDDQYVVSGHEDGTVRLWDVAARAEVAVLNGHGAPVRGVAFSPDGRFIASGGEDNSARLWDVATRSPLRTFTGHSARVMTVAFSPGGARLATGGDDQTIRIWDVGTGALWKTLTESDGSVRALSFNPTGDLLASGATDGIVRLWDVEAGRQVRTFGGHSGWVWAVAFSPDGMVLASGGRDNTARLWDVTNGTELAVLNGHTGWVMSVAFSPDGSTLLTGGGDGTARLWDVVA